VTALRGPTMTATRKKRKKKGKAAPLPRKSAAQKTRAKRILQALYKHYPDAHCELDFSSPHELLVATILSAQATDVAVNRATPKLFEDFPTPADYAAATPKKIEPYVRSLGFFRNKAKAVHAAMKAVAQEHGGRVPDTMDELLKLHGVARKTANVVLGNAFGIPGLTVDTHMKRIHRRLGLTRHDDPVKIERDLMELIPEREWTLYSHRVIHHGRVCCDARRPQCEICPLRPDCPWPESRDGRRVVARVTAGRGA
jgi:endonuclease-3